MAKKSLHIGSVVLMAIYIISLMRIYTPSLEYAINKDFITENLCVNKEKPSLNCEGKCYLKSETGKIATEESGKSVKVNTIKAEEVPASAEDLTTSCTIGIEIKNHQFYLENYDLLFLREMFQPPQS